MRAWNDSFFGPGDPRSGNYQPDCNLLNPEPNGECVGAWSDRNFGQSVVLTSRNAPDSITGFNQQSYNWQGSVSFQHELRPGLSVNLGYFRTWYGNFLATDNLAVTPSDYSEYCFTAPTDDRLGETSGERICGLYDLNPDKFGQVDNLITQQSHYGDRSEIYNGVDLNMTARFLQGGQVAGGMSIGRTTTENCGVIDTPSTRFCKVTPPWSSGTQVKFLVVYPLPWDLQTSVIYQNFSGIPTGADIVLTNAVIAPSLGRNLSGCAPGAAVCNQTRTELLIPPLSLYEPRVQQVDLRFSKSFRFGGVRANGNIDLANLFNTGNVLAVTERYGPAWLNVLQTIGGRMIKFSTQVDF